MNNLHWALELSISASNWISKCATYFGCFVIDLHRCMQKSVYCISLLFAQCDCTKCQSRDALLTLQNVIQCFQSKALCTIVGAPCYIFNDTLYGDLWIPTVNAVNNLLSTHCECCLHAHIGRLYIFLQNSMKYACELRKMKSV